MEQIKVGPDESIPFTGFVHTIFPATDMRVSRKTSYARGDYRLAVLYLGDSTLTTRVAALNPDWLTRCLCTGRYFGGSPASIEIRG